jgi:co-chaperonin GroES (HSP10)
MTPIGKNIVIKTIDEEIKTTSGLLLSAEDASGFRYKKGQVVKPGTEVEVINHAHQ